MGTTCYQLYIKSLTCKHPSTEDGYCVSETCLVNSNVVWHFVKCFISILLLRKFGNNYFLISVSNNSNNDNDNTKGIKANENTVIHILPFLQVVQNHVSLQSEINSTREALQSKHTQLNSDLTEVNNTLNTKVILS